jgi:hypothetical protein
MGVPFITDGRWIIGTGKAQVVVKEGAGWKVKDCDEYTPNRNRSIKAFTSDLIAPSKASNCIFMSYGFIVKNESGIKADHSSAYSCPSPCCPIHPCASVTHSSKINEVMRYRGRCMITVRLAQYISEVLVPVDSDQSFDDAVE